MLSQRIWVWDAELLGNGDGNRKLGWGCGDAWGSGECGAERKWRSKKRGNALGFCVGDWSGGRIRCRDCVVKFNGLRHRNGERICIL